AGRAVDDRVGDAGGGVAVLLALALAGLVAGVPGRVLDRREEVALARLGRAVVLGQDELAAGRQRRAGARPGAHAVRQFLLLHAGLRGRRPGAPLHVQARVVEDLELAVARQPHQRVRRGAQAEAGRLEVVVGLAVLAGPELVAVFPARDVVLGER